MIHARDVPLGLRVSAYVVVLIGYVFYCYNFNVFDYVRPYLMSAQGFTLGQTAQIAVLSNAAITVGAFLWAALMARLGERRGAAAVAAALGLFAAMQAAATHYLAWMGAHTLVMVTVAGYYVAATGAVVTMFPARLRGKLVALNSAMFPISNIMIGLLGGALGDGGWRWLLWLGATPLLLAPLLYLLLPDPRRVRGYGEDDAPAETTVKGSWREMLSPPYRRLTLGCILLSGIDFNAYQLFLSLLTVYLKQVGHVSAVVMGQTFALVSVGSLIGSFAWAAVSDRFGRRSTLVGYLLCAVCVVVFLFGSLGADVQRVVGFVFGFGLACTAAWGAWFAEMFPARLRPHGASLFHGGHALAFMAPLFSAWASPRFGLAPAMAVAAVVYVAGAALWATLPETLERRDALREAVA